MAKKSAESAASTEKNEKPSRMAWPLKFVLFAAGGAVLCAASYLYFGLTGAFAAINSIGGYRIEP